MTIIIPTVSLVKRSTSMFTISENILSVKFLNPPIAA